MNALQIIPPKPVARARRSALRLRVSDAILLLALIGGMSMSRGEEGTVSEPGAAVVSKDITNKAGDKDKSPSLTQPAAVSASAAAQVSGRGGDDEKTSASALPATPAPAGAGNDAKVGSDAGRVLATLSATSSVRCAEQRSGVQR